MNIVCPICQKPLQSDGRSARCENGHCFDYARQGYLNLLLKQSGSHGDNRQMVQARSAFLNRGFYQPLQALLQQTADALQPQVLADLGCGEGYYTAELPGREKYGIDLSREAIHHAAARDHTTQYLIASIFHLPFPDGSVDVCTTVFAPPAAAEVSRVLKPGGYFLCVTPGPRHLIELKQLLYDTPYENEPAAPVEGLTKLRQIPLTCHFRAEQTDLQNLFQMTPYAYRTGKSGQQKLAAAPAMDLTGEFLLSLYQKKETAALI